LKVTIRGENTLILTVPNQPDYELIPIMGNEFNIKDLEGYSVIFSIEGGAGKVAEIILNQPNGIFRAKKKYK